MGFEWADELVEPQAPHRVHHLGRDGVADLELHAIAPASNGQITVSMTASVAMEPGDLIDLGTVEAPGLPPIHLGTQHVSDHLRPGDGLHFVVSLVTPDWGEATP